MSYGTFPQLVPHGFALGPQAEGQYMDGRYLKTHNQRPDLDPHNQRPDLDDELLAPHH